MGFNEMLLTPEEYIERLIDYSEDNKDLNTIMAFYMPTCNVNVITKLGFGIGELKRLNHPGDERLQLSGAPYMIKVGSEWSPTIPFSNPEDFVTFRWFKQNFICRVQPWICMSEMEI